MNRFKPFRTFLLSCTFAAFALSASPARADLVVNGGFEDPVLPSGTYLDYVPGNQIGSAPGTWVVTGIPGNDVLLIQTQYTETGVTFNSHNGSNALDITGAGNTGLTDGIMETLATTPGGSYLLSFFVGRADDGGTSGNYNGVATVDLSIAGGTPGVYTNSNVTPNHVNYEQFAVAFTATSAATTIAFTNGTPAGTNYAGLDDVSVISTPEPGTLAMAGFGTLLCAGAWLRRRKNARV